MAAAGESPAVTVVTAGGKMFQGGHADAVEELFAWLPDALARRKMLDQLEKNHKRLLGKESRAQNLGVDPDE